MTSALDWLGIDADRDPEDPGPNAAAVAPAAGTAIVSAASLARYDLLSTPVWVYDFRAGSIRFANAAGVAFWQERNLADLGHRPLAAAEVFGEQADRYWRRLEQGQSFDGLWSTTVQGCDVAALCRLVPVRIEDGPLQALVEVTASRRSTEGRLIAANTGAEGGAEAHSEHGLKLLLEGQNAILQLIAKGAELEVTLERIALFLARFFDPRICVVQWLDDDDRTCRHVAAPIILEPGLRRWPPNDLDQPRSSTAADNAMEVTARTATAMAAMCRDLGMTVCWSTGIRGESGQLLGTIALLASAPQPLDDDQRRVVGAMVQLAAFAIENDRHKVALRSANERLLSLSSMIPGVVYQRVVRPDGDIRYTYISEGARELFGVAPDEILADPQALFDRHGPEYYATFRERLMAASRSLTMWDVEAEIIDRDGNRKFTHAIARPQPQPDGAVVWNGLILDQTRIKEAERATAAAEARTRDTIIDSIPQGLVLFDADDRLVTSNTQFASLYPSLADVVMPGVSYAEVVGAEVARGIDCQARATDDEAGLVAADDPDGRRRARLAGHQADDQVYERRLADGRWILVNEHRTADGGTVILHTDITELKDREVALTRSNRELEAFAAIASHDLQEPLRKIEAFGDRLARKYAEALGSDGRVYVERIQVSASRVRALINDLLDYSRVTTRPRPFTAVDLGKVVAEAIEDLAAVVRERSARIEVGALPTIEADAVQMRQLFGQLLANALEFHKPGEAPTVRITARLRNGSSAEVSAAAA